MRIVAVTACTTGIAHTYMAAEKLAEVAKLQGHEIKVETQGALGIENQISESDIKAADLAIIAVDIDIEGIERFQNIKTVKVPVEKAIQSPEELFSLNQ